MIASTDPTSSLPARPAGKRDERAENTRRETLHDAGLVTRFNAGDETAFVEIMDRHRERIFAVALSLLKNRTDAQEIVQDTFIRVHGALGRFRGDCSLATWMHRITLNLARNRYWYFFRRRRHLTFSLDCTVGEDGSTTFSDLLAEESAGPERSAGTREFSVLVAACMERLSPDQREILTLRNAHDRPYRDIAAQLGIRIGTVKSRIARAREQLRVLLAEACPEFGPEAEPAAWFEPMRPAGGMSTVHA
jgi:RNA polymerase sigma-70 factor (ECF subfamily)